MESRKEQQQIYTVSLPGISRFLQPAFCLFALMSASYLTAGETPRAAEEHFTLKVLPLLQTKCFGCHGKDPQDIRGEYNMLSRAGLLAGGESGEPSLIPGKPQASPLYQAVLWDGLEMPPKENDRLTAVETEQIRQWIAAGAPWPSLARQDQIRKTAAAVVSNAEGRLVSTSGGTSTEWTNRRYQPEDLWAFEKVRPTSELLPAEVTDHEAIDYFINQKLAEADLSPAAEASPRQLIIRASYDLTGLPPAPAEIDNFIVAYSRDAEQAWEALIDRLLASPRYGEHWGRHWLDVTRYADTGGMSNDYERSNMWRYRDYVIRAFNDDKPYHDFIIEQLAGDELADRSVVKRMGGDQKTVHQTQLSGKYTDQEAEWIIATGFLRLGPWDNAMVEPDAARQMYLDDLVNITGQTFLAQTLRCCKCHDHKFDPIPTRDYYRIYAAFSTTHMAERPVPLLSYENRDGFEKGKAHVEQMLQFAVQEKNRLIQKREEAARAWFKEHNLPYKNEAERRDLPDDAKPPRHVGLDHVEQGELKVREQDEWIWTRRLERYQPMAQSVFNAEHNTMPWNGARNLRIKRKPTKQQVVSFILTGGALEARGDVVQPGVLSAVSIPAGSSTSKPGLVTTATEGRRTELARWIAHSDNGLTTRAIVNRIWQYHFGTGLAANANNFGAKGAKPTHPELLDWLAGDFVTHGWRIKRLHRRIMLSEVYRRSSIPNDTRQLNQADPNNRLLSCFPRRRLSAEELRDGILKITGELVYSAGGVPVMPEINMEVALQPRMIQFSLAPAYQPSPTPAERNRRSIYAYHVRGQADPFTELFNQPNPNESCELRESAAVTPQVFTLLNSDQMIDRSIAFALRLQQERDTVPEQVNRAFRLALGRPASEQELRRLQQYVTDMRDYHTGVVPEATRYPQTITRSLVEEFSGQPFEYQEILPVFTHYQADKKPADVSTETRALADLCLLLFNTNEFMYVE
ncbi:PSD1 and planctomycete cytochrome C domain-containing protein [Gimesia chilikensis]|uniref:PSD1 and planctomycete cytochrome C domain-containing protein n=1 Tax=Gimesia chilikensis TaxID=2605989 RepID=UPI00118AFF0A|nr:PSD1 and planctomycete cytochrome C domain-containing protein [Gimesia chilikensis]QDT84388.1 Planctomycete cytochrome C [Gimesia chilikensis]